MITRERLGGCLFLALSLFYGAQISDIQQLPVDALEAMNARSLPMLLCGVGVVLSIALIVLGGAPGKEAIDSPPAAGKSVVGKSVADKSVADRSIVPRDVLTVVLLLLWTIGYAYLLQWIGFWAATLTFLVVGFVLLGEHRPLKVLLVGVLMATLLWLLLRFGLGLYLPPGSLW